MKIIIDEFIEHETELVKVTQQLYEDSIKSGLKNIQPMHIEYHRTSVFTCIIIWTCFMNRYHF